MRRALHKSSSVGPGRVPVAISACAVLLSLVLVAPARATPFIWDQDTNGIDDRIESVNLLGYSFSFEAGDTLGRQRIAVDRLGGGLGFGIYVVFDHDPTPDDLLALTAIGLPVLYRFEGVPAVRSHGTFAQVQLAVSQNGVERVEAINLSYPEVHDGTASLGARDPSTAVFPTWYGSGGADGSGVVVAFLDTGINDAPAGLYPGHESLIGRCVGGAEFTHADSLLNTPRDGSVNPVDRGGDVTHSHGTHVASIAVGTGGLSGYAMGIASGARFVDVKVLSDGGSGIAVGDGIDWCIHNRARIWDGVHAGIQVINLSLSSTDLTDGNDVVCRLVDRAVELGIVVVASMGNAGRDHFVPSPAGARSTLAVGALDVQRTAEPDDDTWASFNNTGPRADDGDASPLGELKPDVLAPGVAVLSADGSLTSDGGSYQRLSGTSMSAAFVTGVVAVLRSEAPGLTPNEIADLLHATGRRSLAGAPAGVPGPDVRWRSTIGFGCADLYAARLEMQQPGRSQIVRVRVSSTPDSGTAVVVTQRERGAATIVLERAPDVGGAPGTFVARDSIAAGGDSSLARAVNRNTYHFSWPVSTGERGVPFWYRASFTEGFHRYDSPARSLASSGGPPIATIELTVVHNAYDNDITGLIASDSGASGAPPFGSNASGIPLPGSSAAISSDWVDGESTAGNVAWTFRIDVTAGTPGLSEPPSPSQPWWLRVEDEGYLNRVGRVTAYQVIWHGIGGDQVFAGSPLPLLTVQGQTVYTAAPAHVVGVDDRSSVIENGIRARPNPIVSGAFARFELPVAQASTLDILDLAGRRVACVPVVPAAETSVATWNTRDASGRALPPGVYLARYAGCNARRIVVIQR